MSLCHIMRLFSLLITPSRYLFNKSTIRFVCMIRNCKDEVPSKSTVALEHINGSDSLCFETTIYHSSPPDVCLSESMGDLCVDNI